MYRFEELEVWKKSACLSTELYKSFINSKDFGFRDQITRASLSIPSNIAEGYERESRKEVINFLLYAKGSAGELRTQIYIGMKIGYIEKIIGKKWITEAESISKMLQTLIKQFKHLNSNKT
jgi:four helix bundle protein